MPLRHKIGNRTFRRATPKYRDQTKCKLHAYHLFIEAGIVSQRLLHYLAIASAEINWNCFGSWLRTIRPGIPPSKLPVASALRRHLPGSLLNSAKSHIVAKLLAGRQDTNRMQNFGFTT